ncbi:unnamed protein product, partial [Didymodactylos carnosus]
DAREIEFNELKNEKEMLESRIEDIIRRHDEQLKYQETLIEEQNADYSYAQKENEDLKAQIQTLSEQLNIAQERFVNTQNLVSTLKTSITDKDLKIKRLEETPSSFSRTAAIRHQAAPSVSRLTTSSSLSGISIPQTSQQKVPDSKKVIGSREKRLATPSATESSSPTKKIQRNYSQKQEDKAVTLNRIRAEEQQTSINSQILADDCDDVASVKSVNSVAVS